MVDCSFVSPEGISACARLLQVWVRTVGDLIGLGSVVILLGLTAYIRNLRLRLKLSKAVASERFFRAKNAEEAQNQFKHRIDARESTISDFSEKIRILTDDNSMARAAVKANAGDAIAMDRAVEITARGDTTFWCRPPLPLHETGLPLQLNVGCPTLLFANQKGE